MGAPIIPVMNSASKDLPGKTGIRVGEARFIVVLVLCMVGLPPIVGEIFPFTSAPMFRDRPEVYCDYTVTSPKGEALALRNFQLQRNYDGNPSGMGAGVKPAPTLDRFGVVPDIDAVRRHVRKRLRVAHPELAFVDVQQRVVGAVDSDRVGLVRETTIRVNQDAR